MVGGSIGPLFGILVFSLGSSGLFAQEDAAASEAPAPPPAALDVSGLLTGDWDGRRSELAAKGLTLDLQWTQSVQGVIAGGRDPGWEYGTSVDLLANIDLGKMNVLEGGFVRARAEGRTGESVNGSSGTILPVNTDMYFPITGELDESILTVTELSYTQFLSPKFGAMIGKFQTLDGDPNEFASGRGSTQFMNLSFAAPNLVGTAIPYSTLGGGVLFLPTDRLVISSMVVNTTDSSTSAGFDDIGDGTTWVSEAQFQYRLGELPGGMNLGFAYAFDNEFLNFSKSGIEGGEIVLENEEETWTLYWGAWQYLYTLDDAPARINPADGRPDLRGLGLFARLGLIDEDTSIVEWSGSVGLGGRGLVPSRAEDTFGVGVAYTRISDDPRLASLALVDDAYGFESFYSFSLAPGVALTADVQVLDSALSRVDTTVITGARLNIRF